MAPQAFISISPKGAPLDREACLDSIRQAKEFFPNYYPEFSFKGFTTHSWLLDPNLKTLLPASSRILQFQELFEIIHTDNDHSHAAIRFIWYRSGGDVASYPEDTSLQRAVKQYLLNGGGAGRDLWHDSFGERVLIVYRRLQWNLSVCRRRFFKIKGIFFVLILLLIFVVKNKLPASLHLSSSFNQGDTLAVYYGDAPLFLYDEK